MLMSSHTRNRTYESRIPLKSSDKEYIPDHRYRPVCPPEGIPLGAFRRRRVAWAHERFPALVARTRPNQCRQEEPLQGWKPGL